VNVDLVTNPYRSINALAGMQGNLLTEKGNKKERKSFLEIRPQKGDERGVFRDCMVGPMRQDRVKRIGEGARDEGSAGRGSIIY